MTTDNMIVFSGSAHPPLAQAVTEALGMQLGKANVTHFSDGECRVDILEHVRGRDVFIVQSTCVPCNDNLMELMLAADALRRASAWRITAVMPYFGYARQDRRVRSARVPISAKVVADMLSGVGIDRIITVDLHADQIQGFFSIPVDNVYSSGVLLEDVMRQKTDSSDMIVVSPDVGGVVRARAIAKRLNDADLAIIDKRRPNANESQVMNIIGDVRGKHCVIVDDIVDTAGTLCQAAAALKEAGAVHVVAYATHPVLSGAAISNIESSSLDELVVTDTIPLQHNAQQCAKIRQISLSKLLSEAMRRIANAESLSSMFPE